jgi:hypothetical protein
MQLEAITQMDGRKKAPAATPLIRKTGISGPTVASVRFFLKILKEEIARKGFYEGMHSSGHLFLPYAIQYAQENQCDYNLTRMRGRYSLKLWPHEEEDES